MTYYDYSKLSSLTEENVKAMSEEDKIKLILDLKSEAYYRQMYEDKVKRLKVILTAIGISYETYKREFE